MSENQELTPEERFAPKLPQQILNQMAEVNAVLGIPENQPEGDGEGDGEGEGQPQGDPGEGQPQGDPGEGEGQPPQPFVEPQQPEDTWEQRARSTHGRLEQALQANQQMARRVNELEEQINSLRLRGAQPPAPAPGPAAKPKLIKETEVEEYGEEFFDVVGRRAREEFVPVVETLAQRVERLEAGQQAVGKVVESTQKRGVYDTLYDHVPQWKQINHSPAFIGWLNRLDPYSGRLRQEMLTEAFSRHDTNRVVNFFQGFLSEVTGTPPNSQARTPSAPPLASPQNGQGNGSGKPSLEQFAAPGRARSVPQPLPPEKPVYTAASIAQFSEDKRTGKYRGREADALAIERDIYQAQHEGRIRP